MQNAVFKVTTSLSCTKCKVAENGNTQVKYMYLKIVQKKSTVHE